MSTPIALLVFGALAYCVGCLAWCAWCWHCERQIERNEPLMWAIKTQRAIRSLPEVER